MRLGTIVWIAWWAWFFFWEGRALWRGIYEDTATWHLRWVMLIHPALALFVLGMAFVLLCHLFLEYLWATGR